LFFVFAYGEISAKPTPAHYETAMDTTEALDNIAATLRRMLDDIEQQKAKPDAVWLKAIKAEFRTLADYLEETSP
jgi:hypothetical protein